MTEESRTRCASCGLLEDLIKDKGENPSCRYDLILQRMRKLEEQGVIELLAGDCPLENAETELDTEQHYTVCHYLRCRSCGTIYFIGACIRGKPVYRKVENLQKENLQIRLWGRWGTYFSK